MEKIFSLLVELQLWLKEVLASMPAYIHEEADTRMLVHMLDAAVNGATSLLA